MTSNHSNVVQMMLDTAHSCGNRPGASLMRQYLTEGVAGLLNEDIKHVKWTDVSPLRVPRQSGKVTVEMSVQKAIIDIDLEILSMLRRSNELWLTLLGDLIVQANPGNV